MDKSEKKKDILARKIHQLNILDSKNPIKHQPFQHQPVQVSESEPPESASERIRSFSSSDMDLPSQKTTRFATRKNCLEIFRELFFGGNGLWMYIQKIVKKKMDT